ncbi:MAG: HAD hydrolase family protein [Actinomycetota bacterium]
MPRSTAFVVIPAGTGPGGTVTARARVGGVPLVTRAIRAATVAQGIDRVIVSTHDAEIAAVARAAGAEVIDRPGGPDDAPETVLLHAVDSLAARGDPEPDVTVLVRWNSPFTASSDIERAVAEITDGGADCALTVWRTHALVWRRGERGAEPVDHPGHVRDAPPGREARFEETGAVLATRTAGLRAAGHCVFGRVALVEVPARLRVEIRSEDDLALADALATRMPHDLAAMLPAVVEAVIFDFDGVLTDNKVVTHQDGTESVVADRSDGLGVERLRHAGFRLVVMSKERNPVVAARCTKLQIECVQGIQDKGPAMQAWLDTVGIPAAHTVFVGNDVNDLDCLRLAGCGLVVADAHPDTLAAADAVLTHPGGHGAVRELADLLLARLPGPQG